MLSTRSNGSPTLDFGLNGSYRYASWRNSGWRAQLATLAPTLAALMADQTEERDALELVALLRNSVHGEPFTPIPGRVAGQTINLIQLPAEDTSPFLAAVGRRGGDAVWGIHPVATTSNGIRIEVDTYVEVLLPAVARSLNALMQATQVERFPGVPPGWVTPPWPSSDAEETEIRKAVRLLAALAEPGQIATP